MRSLRNKLGFLALLCLLAFLPVAAQNDACPTIVKSALDDANSFCSATGRNQACYGNIALQAQPQAGVTDLQFSKPGDMASVGSIQSLTLSALDPTSKAWGVAMMRLQANLPDTLPGQNVTFVLFGNVEIDNATPNTAAPATLMLTAKSTANVRDIPSTRGTLMSSLSSGQTVEADGRSTASDWLRVALDDGTFGWVNASLVKADGHLSTLADVSTEADPPLKPMQAFYFKSGANDAPCSDAPDSGILIQTPEGAGKVNFLVNGVDISLGSTVYLQAQPGGFLTINVLEGGVRVSLYNDVFVPAGSRTQIQLDQNLYPVGGSGLVEPYDDHTFKVLPLRLLPQIIAAAAPLARSAIAAASKALEAEFPLPHVSSVANGKCSVTGVKDTSATLVNNSERLVAAIWIDYDCHEVLYKILPPHASYVQPTFATHLWILRDRITGELLTGPTKSAHGEPITLTASG